MTEALKRLARHAGRRPSRLDSRETWRPLLRIVREAPGDQVFDVIEVMYDSLLGEPQKEFAAHINSLLEGEGLPWRLIRGSVSILDICA
jgi:hypothetical protein